MFVEDVAGGSAAHDLRLSLLSLLLNPRDHLTQRLPLAVQDRSLVAVDAEHVRCFDALEVGLVALILAVADLFLASLIVGAVVVTVRAGLSVGEIFAILTYLIGVIESLIILPWTYQQLIRAREIGGRIAGN